MITNEHFLKESKKFIAQEVTMINVESFLKLVEQFQNERLERLANNDILKNELFAEYLSPALNEMSENQTSKQTRLFFETIAQHYTNSALIAYKLKIVTEYDISEIEKNEVEVIKDKTLEEIEKLLNNEKKNGHKFHTIIHEYIKDSQEYLYDNEKLALKGRSMPSIEERIKEIQKNKEEKKYHIQELEHPKLEAQQFEREMRLRFKDGIFENQIESVLQRIEYFQLGFIGALKKKINNPTGSSEKLFPKLDEQPQLKALKDWAWEEDSVNVMTKVLKIIDKSSINLENTLFKDLNNISEKLESILLDIGSLKKYNDSVKIGLIESINELGKNVKKSNGLKVK